MTIGVPHARQQQVFFPVRGYTTAVSFVCQLFAGLERWIGMIAGDHEDAFPVRRKTQRMRAVLSSAAEVFQFDTFIKLIVPVRIASSVQSTAGTAIDGKVHTVKGVQHSMSAGGPVFAL